MGKRTRTKKSGSLSNKDNKHLEILAYSSGIFRKPNRLPAGKMLPKDRQHPVNLAVASLGLRRLSAVGGEALLVFC